MRQDSYVRFLKSDLYKGHLIREMEGQSLAETKAEMPPPPADDDKKKVIFSSLGLWVLFLYNKSSFHW